MLRCISELGAIDGDCLAVSGETLAQVYGGAARPDGAVVRAAGKCRCTG